MPRYPTSGKIQKCAIAWTNLTLLLDYKRSFHVGGWLSKVVVVSFTPDFGNRRGALISLKYIYFEIYDALSVRATEKNHIL